jgi:Mce-associated membrane protein
VTVTATGTGATVATEAATEPATEIETERQTATDPDADGVADEGADAAAGGPPTWSLLVAAGAAVLSIVLLIIVLAWPGSLGGTSPADQAKRGKAAVVSAEEAADRAVPAVLSYDYRTFDADVEAAEAYLTEDFAGDRVDLLDNLKSEVVREKVVVDAVVSGTALTRVSEDGTRAVVVAFIEQESQKGRAEPQVRKTWASLSMVAEGDDWLIDDICTQEDCA